jgi:hypothetical protein
MRQHSRLVNTSSDRKAWKPKTVFRVSWMVVIVSKSFTAEDTEDTEERQRRFYRDTQD